MKKYRIVETKNSFTGESNFKLQKKSIFGFWYNPLNIDAYTTGIYDNLEDAEYDLNMILSKTTKKIVLEKQGAYLKVQNGRGE